MIGFFTPKSGCNLTNFGFVANEHEYYLAFSSLETLPWLGIVDPRGLLVVVQGYTETIEVCNLDFLHVTSVSWFPDRDEALQTGEQVASPPQPNTPNPTFTARPTFTPLPVQATYTPLPTHTPLPTITSIPSATPTDTTTPTATPTPLPTPTFTPTFTPTSCPPPAQSGVTHKKIKVYLSLLIKYGETPC